MTRITDSSIDTAIDQGKVTIYRGGTLMFDLAQGGTAAASATTGTFAAAAGTAALSGSTWTGNQGTRAYTVNDIVTALKASGILPAS